MNMLSLVCDSRYDEPPSSNHHIPAPLSIQKVKMPCRLLSCCLRDAGPSTRKRGVAPAVRDRGGQRATGMVMSEGFWRLGEAQQDGDSWTVSGRRNACLALVPDGRVCGWVDGEFVWWRDGVSGLWVGRGPVSDERGMKRQPRELNNRANLKTRYARG